MFMHRLALLLGKTVHELHADLGGVREVASWIAYLQLEPPGKTGWEQAAMQCLVAARIAGDKQAKLSNFMPSFEVAQSPEEQRDALKAAFMGGKPNG